jgi:hypothetical protein
MSVWRRERSDGRASAAARKIRGGSDGDVPTKFEAEGDMFVPA